MKRIYQPLIGLILISGLRTSNAQVSNYVFQTYVGTYAPITGGTVMATSTTDDGAFVNPANPTLNQATGPGIPIGFTFTFNGTPYDVFGVDNNGWIAFGQTTLTPNPVNLNNTGLGAALSGASTAPAILQNRVAPLGRDLVANGGNASLRVQTIGTAPNRVCVIQWTNYRPFGGSAASDNLNFQIRLNETTNIVDVVYDSWNIGTSSTAQVGLRGNANTDYNNRIVNATNPWAASIPGTANNSAAAWNATLAPGFGRVYEWLPPNPCNSAPSSNTVVSTFSMVCPNGAIDLGPAFSYSTTGLTYQWYVSTQSAFGPYTTVATGTNIGLSVPNLTATSWYQLVATCPSAFASATLDPVNVMIAPTTTNSVPYFEGFEGIGVNNQLPNCSWLASTPTLVNQTYTIANTGNRIPHTGSKFASFKTNTTAGGDYFYSNGIQMEPGITYSAAAWYITDGTIGWSELSILVGPNQSTLGLLPVTSQTGAVTGQFYQLLDGTFTVPTSGLYYLAIKAVGSAPAQFLTIDDISVTIPCALNAPSLSLVFTPSVICTGQEVNVSVTGADSYSWSTGDLGTVITFTPFGPSNLSVTGTNSVSGCQTTKSELILPNIAPVVSIYAPSSAVCLGSSMSLYAFGANSYTWSNTNTGPSVTVAPTIPTSYTVNGSNSSGCIGQAVFNLGVLSLPSVSASISNPNTVCAGESVTLTGSGASSYQWQSNSIVILTQEAVIVPNASVVYTLTGTNINGCSNTAQLAINVSPCVGINEIAGSGLDLTVFPNPANDAVNLVLSNGLVKQVDLLDLSGRVVMQRQFDSDKAEIDLQNLAAGVYYLKIQSGSQTQVVKLVKN